MRIKPLHPDEVPAPLRKCFNYDSFKVVNGKGTVISVCSLCGNQNRVGIANIRSRIKKHSLGGRCHSCAGILNRRLIKNLPCGSHHWKWNGGKQTTKKGYVRLSTPNGYVAEHRVVLSQKLGRNLLPVESVHHRNGIRDDNRPENLELRVLHHGRGQKYEDLSSNELASLISYLITLLNSRMEAA